MDVFAGYLPKSQYLVCVDSDGCAMDTMDVKHIKCFGPQWITVFGLEQWQEEAMKLWLELNLYTATRGINRFSGLVAATAEMLRRGAVVEDFPALARWVEQSKELSNPALEAEIARNPSPSLLMALDWSKRVNLAIAALPDESKPYPLAVEALEKASRFADVVGVSSANGAAVVEEWEKHGLRQHTRLLCCQEAGTKAAIIGRLLEQGYLPQNVLMVGDAVGDRAAAEANGTWFYPILTRHEGESWKRFMEEALERLVQGSFDAALQNDYNHVLEEALQAR